MIRLLIIGVLFFLLYMLQLNVYKRLWHKHLNVNISFARDHIFQGEQSELQEIIENRKRLPLAMLKVKFQTDRNLDFGSAKGSRTTDRYYRNDMFRIGGGERVTRTLKFKGKKRGYYTIDGADLVAADLLLTTSFVREAPTHTALYVYPMPYDSEELRRSLIRLSGEILTRRHLLEDPFEFRGIREYQPYDNMRTINWKATARTGDLKVNRKNYTSLKYVRIFFNIQDDGIRRKEDCVEACISIVAGLSSGFLSQGLQVSCHGNGMDFVTGNYVSVSAKGGEGQIDDIYRALARIDLEKTPVNFAETFREKILIRSGDMITCFVSPNQYDDFLELLREYQSGGRDYRWFYPVSGNSDPELPGDLQSHIQLIHI